MIMYILVEKGGRRLELRMGVWGLEIFLWVMEGRYKKVGSLASRNMMGISWIISYREKEGVNEQGLLDSYHLGFG